MCCKARRKPDFKQGVTPERELNQNRASDHSKHYSFTNHAVSELAFGGQSTISALIPCAFSQRPPTVPQKSPLNLS